MVAKLSKLFADDCIQLQLRVEKWSSHVKSELKKRHRIIGKRWEAEAIKRVPVDTSTLKQRITSNAYEDDQHVFVTEVGTNIPEYPIDLEFGTQFIAKGAVLRLGISTEITDAQAIHTWAAKEADATGKTSHSRDSSGKLWNDSSRFVAAQVAGPQEQMPWLRPSFNFIRVWVIDQLNAAIEPP